jgi:hypothetical protein
MKNHESDYKNYEQATGERYFNMFIHVDPRTGELNAGFGRGSERGRCGPTTIDTRGQPGHRKMRAAY